MPSPSNLYAEKIFSEHPTVLWALDDKADYISLLSNRNYLDWSFGNTDSKSLLTQKGDAPFQDSNLLSIKGNVPTGTSDAITLISPDLLNFKDLNKELSTFSIGAYVKSLNAFMTSIEIGFEYFDSTIGSMIQKLTPAEVSINNKWIFVSDTFAIPNDDIKFRVVLKIRYLSGGLNPDDYEFLINGVSVGQWSEEFNSTSLGVEIQPLPSNINLNSDKGIEAVAYGLSSNSGYYLAKENSLIAKNAGVPLVFGSQNTTVLYPNGDDPSLIVPGQGFLNDVGRYREYTVEMWVNLTSDTKEHKRLFGPIASTDGLYINGPFIVLKIGDKTGSHYVGEWAKPMLVHIRISNNSASLLVNGDQVILFSINPTVLDLPSEYSGTWHQDWLGFYAYEDMSPIMIDCVAIYPYQVSSLVAKRRFVYGQGVEFPEVINQAYGGTSVYADYPFAQYTSNYMYPDTGDWNQASLDNLVVNSGMLSTPTYSLPDFVFSNKTKDQLYYDCSVDNVQAEDDKFITFRPNSSWNNTNGYILFNRMNILPEETKAIYGIFKIKNEAITTPEVLIKIEDVVNGNYFSIEVIDHSIRYALSYFGTNKIFYTALGVQPNEIFAAGIDIDKFIEYFGENLGSFFGNKNQLAVYVGGTKELTNTFTGNIYKIGFCSSRNINEIRSAFNFMGVPLDYENIFNFFNENIIDGGYYSDVAQYILDGGTPYDFATTRLLNHIASYTFITKYLFGLLVPDISASGYWEDYIPLTYFAKYVKTQTDKTYYDLDFLQFNIDYPAPSKYLESETVGEWQYRDLLEEYAIPTQKTYSFLDNHLYTNYVDYQDLAQRSVKTYSYDTENSFVRSYLTFQYIANGANAASGFFTKYENPSNTGVVVPTEDWLHTKYEVVDNMIVYPPSGVDFNELAVVVHLDFKIDSVLTNQVKVRSLQIASQAFNENSFNPIGTRFGTKVYPYKKDGFYYDYKSKNPFTIYKKSMPYLYLTRNSGFEIKGQYNPAIDRGLSIPINQTKAQDYQVMAMQLFLKYDKDFFPYAPTQIFEVVGENSVIKFFMVADSPDGKRAKVYAINGNTGRVENGIAFYLNGKLVKNPVLTIKEWSAIGLSFANIIDFTNYIGEIKITGPVLVNNISYYQSTTLQEVKTIIKRQWFQVLNDGSSIQDWEYWVDAGNWENVLILSTTSFYGVNPQNVYDAFVGTNKIIIDDEHLLSFNKYEYNFNTDVTWQSKVSSAV